MKRSFGYAAPVQEKRRTVNNVSLQTETSHLNMAVLNRKIAEVEILLQELYSLRDYFEQKNKPEPIPNYYA